MKNYVFISKLICQFAIICLGLFSSLTFALPASQIKINNIGINLSPINDWSTNLSFLNVFRRARTWVSQPSDGSQWDDERKIQLDKHGYIKKLQWDQRAISILFIDSGVSQFRCETGFYQFDYEGEGSFDFINDARVISHDKKAKSAIIELTNNKCDLVIFRINFTNANNYLRNFTLVHKKYIKDFLQGDIFHPRLLKNLEIFSVLRFMDWGKTNDSNVSRWSNRPISKDYSYQNKGVALEALIELANKTQKSPWFCIPHQVDNDYIFRFAQLLKRKLDPKIPFYIEHSNEVWNGIFAQHDFSLNKGQELKLNSDENVAGQFYHWQRTAKIGEIFELVFKFKTAQERKKTYQMVLGGQSSGLWFAKQGYQFLKQQNKTQYIDAIAIAPYFGGELGSEKTRHQVARFSIPKLFDLLSSDLENIMQKEVKVYVNYFSSYQLPVIAYEAGQHLVGVGDAKSIKALNNLFQRANRSKKMAELYHKYLSLWNQITGNQLIALFTASETYSKHGNFGLKEYDLQQDAVKYNQIKKWVSNK